MAKHNPSIMAYSDIQMNYRSVPKSQKFYLYERVIITAVMVKAENLVIMFTNEIRSGDVLEIPLTKKNEKRLFKILHSQIGIGDASTNISILFNYLIGRDCIMVTCHDSKCKKVLHDLILFTIDEHNKLRLGE